MARSSEVECGGQEMACGGEEMKNKKSRGYVRQNTKAKAIR